MKKLSTLFVTTMVVCVALVAGCNSRRDPKADPKFNEAAGANPGAIKMEPIAGSGKPKT